MGVEYFVTTLRDFTPRVNFLLSSKETGQIDWIAGADSHYWLY